MIRVSKIKLLILTISILLLGCFLQFITKDFYISQILLFNENSQLLGLPVEYTNTSKIFRWILKSDLISFLFTKTINIVLKNQYIFLNKVFTSYCHNFHFIWHGLIVILYNIRNVSGVGNLIKWKKSSCLYVCIFSVLSMLVTMPWRNTNHPKMPTTLVK